MLKKIVLDELFFPSRILFASIGAPPSSDKLKLREVQYSRVGGVPT